MSGTVSTSGLPAARTAMAGAVVAREIIEVHGVVQGVGFRPFVAAVATGLGLSGHVGNDATKVFIEVTGPPAAIEELAERLTTDAPPLARVDRLTRIPLPPADGTEHGFDIVASRPADGARTLIPPDTATCADCVAELFDPADRRHRHPFITCTNCGPRFTIITDVPYDRDTTTMAGFAMCPACRREYDDPADRRHHAQPVACHDCGPTLRFRPIERATVDQVEPTDADPTDPDPTDLDPIDAAAAALAAGAVLAIKGLGGYHLACRADDTAAVARLRERKQRADKPFAVMAADLAMARQLAEIDDAEAALLTSPAAPIVLLLARDDAPRSDLVAPGNPLIGIMVAYTPIHHLLLDRLGQPVVMTSANRGGEPLAATAEQLAALDDLFDAVLDHDRPIHQPCDDSVVRVVGERLLPIRRARGYAPLPIAFPPSARPVLAAGAELKNTFCVTSDPSPAGTVALVSQHVGDMANLATLDAFAASVDHYCDLYQIEPEVVAADTHPTYLSSRWARRHPVVAAGGQLLEVQHHHAHIAAIMAEHQLDPTDPVLGFAFDGTGYGPDGTIWGGEVLDVSVDGYHRTAHLRPILLPGGDAAIEHPARVALAHLRAAGLEWSDDLAPVATLTTTERNLLARMLDGSVNTVPTTSMGRLFDAVASLLGLRHRISYEAQAAIELEIVAADGWDETDRGYRFDVVTGDNGAIIDPGPVLRDLVNDVRTGVPTRVAAWRFHQAVVDVVVLVATAHRDRTGRSTVALSGGVFQNALLVERCVDALADRELTALTHALVPPNDGGLALGQAFIAANRTAGNQTRARQPEEN